MGKFYVIEGLDGSGKSTQGELLKAHFEKLGKKVRVLSFPCYGEVSASLVEFYLFGGGFIFLVFYEFGFLNAEVVC